MSLKTKTQKNQSSEVWILKRRPVAAVSYNIVCWSQRNAIYPLKPSRVRTFTCACLFVSVQIITWNGRTYRTRTRYRGWPSGTLKVNRPKVNVKGVNCGHKGCSKNGWLWGEEGHMSRSRGKSVLTYESVGQPLAHIVLLTVVKMAGEEVKLYWCWL